MKECCGNLAGIKSLTSWSPVGSASDPAPKAAFFFFFCLKKSLTYSYVLTFKLSRSKSNLSVSTADIFLISPWKRMLWYSSEAPHWGSSDEYHNICFHGKIRYIFLDTPVIWSTVVHNVELHFLPEADTHIMLWFWSHLRSFTINCFIIFALFWFAIFNASHGWIWMVFCMFFFMSIIKSSLVDLTGLMICIFCIITFTTLWANSTDDKF